MRSACLLVLLAACAIDPDAPRVPPDANRMRPDHAPTPFTAEEIRTGCPRGRSVKWRLEAARMSPQFQVLTFGDGTSGVSRYESTTLDAGGKPLKAAERTETSWEKLQSHASFPAAATRITSGTCTTPAGTFDCWIYDVTQQDGEEDGEQDGGVIVNRRFWFAKELPGPPVRLDVHHGDKLAMRMTMVRAR